MDKTLYLTLQDVYTSKGKFFDFNSQFEHYREEDEGYYALVGEDEYGPFPKDICFLSQDPIDQSKLFSVYTFTRGQDKTTDYYKTVLEVYGIDMKLNHKAQHNGDPIFEEWKEERNKRKRSS